MIRMNNEAKKSLAIGIDKLADVVETTMGPGGRNVLILDGHVDHITKDGITAAKAVKIEDPMQDLGVKILRKASKRTCDSNGDGTSSTIALARAIIHNGLTSINSSTRVTEVKRGMDKALSACVDYINALAIPVTTDQELIDIATISANNDQAIGSLVAEAFRLVNNRGVITIDKSNKTTTTVTKTEGLTFDSGYLSRFFVNNKLKQTVEFDKPMIILMKDKLKSLEDLIEPLQQAVKDNASVLIITPDVDPEVTEQFVNNAINNRLKCCVVKAPGFGDFQKDNITDLAHAVATANRGAYYLGSADKAIITRNDTTIVNGAGDKAQLALHIKELNAMLNVETEDQAKQKLIERISRLQDGAAVIQVGALTELEVQEIKDRLDDAINATRSAIKGGTVIGGGYAYISCLEAIADLNPSNADQALGMRIVANSLEAINKCVLGNCDLDHYNYIFDGCGINAKTGELCDLRASGIIDPAMVVKSVLENAIATAGIFLTTEACIINQEQMFV